MRVESYLLAVSLCCMLPFMAQGMELDADPPSGPPRVALRSFTPIIIETESELLNLYFISNLGEIYVLLQEVTGAAEYSQLVDTSIQNQAVLVAPSGTYTLTIFDTTGNVIHQESNVIP